MNLWSEPETSGRKYWVQYDEMTAIKIVELHMQPSKRIAPFVLSSTMHFSTTYSRFRITSISVYLVTLALYICKRTYLRVGDEVQRISLSDYHAKISMYRVQKFFVYQNERGKCLPSATFLPGIFE